MKPKHELDDIDLNIISIMLDDAKTSYADIGAKLFISGGTVHVRLKKLTEMGIITGSKLKVDFVPYVPFTSGDYWVLDIDEGYETVVVGTPSGFAGWILARDPQISEARLQRGIAALKRNGYDVSQLTMPAQVGG